MDWKDPNLCPEQDACEYCHTRTEQQFHQDIYKSNKCNDMQQSGYCPRGNFCAFAHVENSRSGSNASLHKSSRRQSGQNFADSLRKKISETESMDDTPKIWFKNRLFTHGFFRILSDLRQFACLSVQFYFDGVFHALFFLASCFACLRLSCALRFVICLLLRALHP